MSTLLVHAQIARGLQPETTKMLLRHIDGPVLIDVAEDWKTRAALFARKLIHYEPANAKRPLFSVATVLGREVTAFILAEYAEALVRAGHLEMIPETIGVFAYGPFRTKRMNDLHEAMSS